MRTGDWPIKARLEYYSKPDDSGCVLWHGAKTRNGYGHMKVRGSVTDVHRLAWTCEYGEIPDGMHVLHKCDVRNCINPSHLFLGTNKDNTDDKVAKGRQRNGTTTGEKHHKAKLSFEKVFEMRWREAMGETGTALATGFGVTQATAAAAIRGATWQFECHD
jgi:hypothetical protein